MSEKAVVKAPVTMCAVASALVAVAVAVAVVAALTVVAIVTSSGKASASDGESGEQCNTGHLVVCAAAIIGGAAPSASCCSNLRAQKGCFCQYARNPAYGRYIGSPTARRAIAACLVDVPTC